MKLLKLSNKLTFLDDFFIFAEHDVLLYPSTEAQDLHKRTLARTLLTNNQHDIGYWDDTRVC